MSFNYNPWASFVNPFTPPPLAQAQLKKIENREFVDFGDLLPENQAANMSTIFDRPVIEIDSNGVLTHKDNKAKRAKIN